MTAGAAQTLLKQQRLLPGRRVLLSGTGPLQLAIAAGLVWAGADVAAVLEGNPAGWGQRLRYAPAMWGQWARLREGWVYWLALRQAGVPLRLGWSVVKVEGDGQVQAAVVARLDQNWQPVPGSEQRLEVDTVVIGYGFLPATQLSRLLGCRHDFRPALGGWTPGRDEWLATSCPGVYAAGDGAGIGGAELARLEGRLAGLAAAQRLGKLSQDQLQAAAARLRPALARERRFAAMLNDLFTPGPGLYTLADDDTIICRCEEVRLGELREAVAGGALSANAVKGITRAGMGNCQGRICGELVARIIARESDTPADYATRLEAAGLFTARPPLFPLPLATLAEAADVA
jgi:hypothetical protein